MKVKVGQLKTHLSSYLRKLKETGQPLEICVREQSVAYMTPAAGRPPAPVGKEDALLDKRLRDAGLRWIRSTTSGESLADIVPTPAGDGRTDIETVKRMRRDRDW